MTTHPINIPTFWYMGVKTRLISGFIDQAIGECCPYGGTMWDLMCGTGVVAANFAARNRIIASDVQAYAAINARAMFEHDPEIVPQLVLTLDPLKDLGDAYVEHLTQLERLYQDPLDREAHFISGEGTAQEYREFCENETARYLEVGEPKGGHSYRNVRPYLHEGPMRTYRRSPRTTPYLLCSAYYQNIYLGVRQSIAVDSLRFAIDQLPSDWKRTHYLSCLLQAVSRSTSGTSHFAQPTHLTSEREVDRVLSRRKIDIWNRLIEHHEWLRSFAFDTPWKDGNQVLTGDAIDLLENPPDDVDVVYLDPPYTADNYSRFYHLLEVLAIYNYPRLAVKDGHVLRGRYPILSQRHRSGFCSRAKVEGTFRQVLQGTAAIGASLVISYSSTNGLLWRKYAEQFGPEAAWDKFHSLCAESFGDVEFRRRDLMHSGQGDSNIEVEELLIVCRDPRSTL